MQCLPDILEECIGDFEEDDSDKPERVELECEGVKLVYNMRECHEKDLAWDPSFKFKITIYNIGQHQLPDHENAGELPGILCIFTDVSYRRSLMHFEEMFNIAIKLCKKQARVKIPPYNASVYLKPGDVITIFWDGDAIGENDASKNVPLHRLAGVCCCFVLG